MSDIDKILDSGSLEDIDKILSTLDEGGDESEALAAVESGDTGEEATPAADDPPSQSEKPTAETDGDEPPETPETPEEDDEPPVVLAKDGKNQIPYSVLEQERQQAAALKSQLEELNRKNALLEQQLTRADIKPKELPEKFRFTPEQLEGLESYGEIGEAVAVLAQQNASLLERLQAENIQPTPGAEAQEPSNPLAENPDTMRWAENDAHWSVVETVNSALDADPKWAGQSLEQRIPEIVRRTKAALGEPDLPASGGDVAAAAAKAVTQSQRAAPNSLTDVGGEVPGATKSIIEQLEEGDASDIEAFLAEQTAKGKSVDEVLSSLLV
ncbi:MAG: hypothetical protein CME38_01250 [Haliea sp.]|nr:hypothetical protein [Haliea sp.]